MNTEQVNEMLDRVFTPDVRVKLDSDEKVSGFELLTRQGVEGFLSRRHDGLLGQDYSVVLRVMSGLTFEVSG